jgi:hypothetical protein
MMPSSRKGRGKKKIARRPVPISSGLAFRLLKAAQGRPANAPLLIKPSGEPWKRSDHTRLFARAVAPDDETEAGRDDQAEVVAGRDDEAEAESVITIYALRHTSIVRQLLAGVPTRVVAVNHDTSVAMLERTYSRYIGDHSDSLSRRAILDLDEPEATNVVPIRQERHAS